MDKNTKNKEKRIDKELFLLRNLPKDYKLGKKDTQLGLLIDLEIDRSAVKSSFLDKSIQRFYFDILIREKYPFQPPIIMTRTTFCAPSLADGRDLLYHIIPKDNKSQDENEESEWRPSMNLYELIQCIPEFIQTTLQNQNGLLKKGNKDAMPMIGKFYLGLQYDYQQIWMQNQSSKSSTAGTSGSQIQESGVRIYPCTQEKEFMSINQKGDKTKKRAIIDVYIVISESIFLVIEPETKMKGIGKLVSWGTLPTIDNIRRNLDNPDYLTISWRKVDHKEPWVLNFLLPNNAQECVQHILKHLKKQGLVVNKKYQKKKKIAESEVTGVGAMQPTEVEMLLKTIKQYELVILENQREESKMDETNRRSDSSSDKISPTTVQQLISLYNKAIEYYSAMNDERYTEFFKKLQIVLCDEKLQKILEDGDTGSKI